MGWNDSSRRVVSSQSAKKSSSNSLARFCIVFGLIVFVAAVVGYFVFDDDGSGVAKERASKKISDVSPDVRVDTNKVAAVVEAPKSLVVTNFNEKGVWYDEHGRPHYKPARIIHMGSNTVINGKHWVPPRKLFKHMSEAELDRVLSARPGDRIIGETNWRFFAKDLKDSMVDAIRIDPEDTPDEIARKEAVKAAKKDLAIAIGNGEDPVRILKEAQADLNKLATIYDNLNKELYDVRMSGEMTEEEIEDYVKAANKMLESHNILTKRFYTPSEIREKAAAAKERKILKQEQK